MEIIINLDKQCVKRLNEEKDLFDILTEALKEKLVKMEKDDMPDYWFEVIHIIQEEKQ